MKKTSTKLRSGFTTGACAAAAAKAAALMIARQELVHEISINLPAGFPVVFSLHGQTFLTNSATCFVIKDAGDDPDVTNGAEIHATVRLNSPRPSSGKMESSIIIEGGTGIGKVTKPGLAVLPGEWAINPVPRRMIEEEVFSVFASSLIQHPTFSIQPRDIHVVISIPDGEQLAQKTLNARLGIIGGLSILGTTGIVLPISSKAWTDTIDAALDVARACGCPTAVLSTGRTSEMAAQKRLQTSDSSLSDEAFIMMGDHIAHALHACRRRGFDQPVIACQFAKLLKIACGHENTHAAVSEVDLATLKNWVVINNLPGNVIDIIDKANTARQIIIDCSFNRALLEIVCHHALYAVRRHVSEVCPSFLIADYSGNIVLRS